MTFHLYRATEISVAMVRLLSMRGSAVWKHVASIPKGQGL